MGRGEGGQIEEEIQFNSEGSTAITENSDIHYRPVLKIHNLLEARNVSETFGFLVLHDGQTSNQSLIRE